jgi:hypothetical protein
MTTALQRYRPCEFFYVIAYMGVQDNKVVTGFVNPKLGRFVCTQDIQWATKNWGEAIELAAIYSYEASRCNEVSVYQNFLVFGIMPRIQYVFLK